MYEQKQLTYFVNDPIPEKKKNRIKKTVNEFQLTAFRLLRFVVIYYVVILIINIFKELN